MLFQNRRTPEKLRSYRYFGPDDLRSFGHRSRQKQSGFGTEEFSGKPFEYKEILPVFENYLSDKKASDVSAETRALADLCLMLFNSNEFMYVY